MRFVWILLAVILAAPPLAEAQNGIGELIKGVAKDVVLDPTTYGPFGASWLGKQLDWNSSQIFFEHGFVESNADFTVNGLPHDKPISHAAGNRKVILMSLPVLQLSLINNATTSAVERTWIRSYPNKKKLIKTIGWIERVAVASYLVHKYSDQNLRQWQRNKDLARELGYR